MKKIFFSFFVALMMFSFASCHKDTQLDDDLDKIKAFLDEHGLNASKKQNIYKVVLMEGNGPQCNAGDRVAVKYIVTSINHPDVVIDQQTKHAWEVNIPSVVPDATANLITGFQIALTQMKEGERSRFYIPSSLAYGEQVIGDGETGEDYNNLIYEIELCEILSNGNKH